MTKLTPRGRIVSVALAGAVVVAVVVIAALALSGGSSAKPPDVAAARLVPADALAYLNVSLDRGRPGVAGVQRAGSRLPDYGLARAALDQRLGAMLGTGNGFAASAHAWLGDEGALAVLANAGSGGRAGSLIVLSVRRPSQAQRFLAGRVSSSGAAGSTGSASYRGTTVYHLPGATYAALLPGYMVLGQVGSVDAAIDVQHGSTPSLAGSSAYRRAVAGAPAGRVADLYAPAIGVTRLLGGRGGLLGAVRTLLDQPGALATNMSLSAAPGGLRVRVHSVFAANSGRTTPFSFEPSLMNSVPPGTAMALDLGGLPGNAPRLLAAAANLGIGGAVGPLLSRLGSALRAEGVNLRPVLALFSRQTAVGVTSAGGRPAIVVVARTQDPKIAKVDLADLQPALISLFPAASSGPGVAPLFTSHQVNGITIHQLRLGPGFQLDYAVWKHLIGISTSVSALSALNHRGPSLTGASSYHAVFADSGGQLASLVFLDLKVLVPLGEQAGLLRGPGFRRLAPDLNRVQAIGLRSTSGKADSTSELYFKIP